MLPGTLSEAAISLLKLHAKQDGYPLTDENREAHRELARHGLMVAMHTFRDGRESRYKFTKAGWDFVNAPSLSESA